MQQAALAFNDDPMLDVSAHRGGSVSDLSLRKATGAIHIRNDINTLQRKITNALLLSAGAKQLADFTILSHQVSMSFLKQTIGYTSKNDAHLRTAIEGLVGTRIHWDIVTPDGEQEWGVAALLADAVVRAGTVTYSFAPQLRKKLATPEHWAPLSMNMVRLFASGPGLALYENCAPYRTHGKTPLFPLAMLRELLGATAASYDSFRLLNSKVIKPAVEEVNKIGVAHDDLQVEPVFERQQRRVIGIRFMITHAGHPESPMADVDDRLLSQLTLDFCLMPSVAHRVLVEHDTTVVEDVMAYVGQRYGDGKIAKGKIAPYFLQTLKRWDGSAALTSRLDRPKPATPPRKVKDPAQQAAKEKASAERASRLAEAEQRLAAMSVDERVAFDSEFEAYVRAHHTPVLGVLQKNGADHPMLKAIFRIFLEETLLGAAPATAE